MKALKLIYEEMAPDKKTSIKALFSTSLASQKGNIVAVRSQDIVTTLERLARGKIRVAVEDKPAQDQRIMSKEPGWFYASPVYDSIFFKANPHLVPQTGRGKSGELYEVVGANTAVYAPSIVLSTALIQNAAPVLKEDWFERACEAATHSHMEMFIDRDPIPKAEAIESIVSAIQREVDTLPKKGDPVHTILEGKYGYWVLKSLAASVKEGIDPKEIIGFLLAVPQKRGGVILAFSAKLLEQGDFVTNATEDEYSTVLHDSDELALHHTTGSIDLEGGVVLAIETLGDYEDAVLKHLGLA